MSFRLVRFWVLGAWRGALRAALIALMASFATASAAAEPGKAPKTIVFIGDSIAQGYGVKADESFPEVTGRWLRARGHETKIVNGGVSGSLSSGADGRLRWYLKLKPDIVVLELGGNDGIKGTPPESIKDNLGKAIDLARASGVTPVLAGMKMFPNLGPDYARRFEGLYRDLAREKKVAFIPFLLEGVAANPKLNQADGKHPNPEGHRIIGENVGKALEPLL